MNSLSHVLFFLAAGLALLSAVLVISQKKVIYSALYLVLHFLSLTLLTLLLSAPFIALIQVLIYAGAIMVLFLFVIMLMGNESDHLKAEKWQRRLGGGMLLSLFFLLGWGMVTGSRWFGMRANLPGLYGGIDALGALLFSKYLLFFELVSILLLVAIIGVVVMGRKAEMEEEAT